MPHIPERTVDEWAAIEAAEHDQEYTESYPFGLDQYQFTVEHALWYEDYAYKKGRRRDRGHRTRKVFELMDLKTLQGKNILDIGCGNGQYSVLFALLGATVTGIDLSPIGIDVARRMAKANGVSEQCTFLAGEFASAAIPEAAFDIVLLHEVYHHVIKYPGVDDAISRAAVPGGRIILADTVRGASLIDRGRSMVKFFRFKRDPVARQHEANLGDIMLTVADYEALGARFSYHRIYLMSFFYMVKQTALQYHLDKWYVRALLRVAKHADDVLLAVVPSLRNGCGEAVLYIKK